MAELNRKINLKKHNKYQQQKMSKMKQPIHTIVMTLALLACVNTAAPDVFLGRSLTNTTKPRNLVAKLNELSLECTDILNNLVISEYLVNVAGNPAAKTLDVTLLLTLNKDLFKCNKANSDSKYENIKHVAFWMDKSNNHANPYENVDRN